VFQGRSRYVTLREVRGSLRRLRSLETIRGNWNFTRTLTRATVPSSGVHPRQRAGFGQLLGRSSMILLVPSLILSLLVLAWIAWIAFEPRSSQPPHAIRNAPAQAHAFFGCPADDKGIGMSASAHRQENDYQRHVRIRIDEPQLSLGAVTGAVHPSGAWINRRETDRSDRKPIGSMRRRADRSIGSANTTS